MKKAKKENSVVRALREWTAMFDALLTIRATLGPRAGCADCCPGCQCELEIALQTANDVLKPILDNVASMPERRYCRYCHRWPISSRNQSGVCQNIDCRKKYFQDDAEYRERVLEQRRRSHRKRYVPKKRPAQDTLG